MLQLFDSEDFDVFFNRLLYQSDGSEESVSAEGSGPGQRGENLRQHHTSTSSDRAVHGPAKGRQLPVGRQQ